MLIHAGGSKHGKGVVMPRKIRPLGGKKYTKPRPIVLETVPVDGDRGMPKGPFHFEMAEFEEFVRQKRMEAMKSKSSSDDESYRSGLESIDPHDYKRLVDMNMPHNEQHKSL